MSWSPIGSSPVLIGSSLGAVEAADQVEANVHKNV